MREIVGMKLVESGMKILFPIIFIHNKKGADDNHSHAIIPFNIFRSHKYCGK